MNTFNPSEHFIDIQGKDYLPVAWRLVWFREDHPLGRIVTELKEWDKDKHTCLFQASVYDDLGNLLAVAHNTEAASLLNSRLQSQYVMMCETGAIGRALAIAGYGTQFSTELEEENRIVDSPIEKGSK